MILCMVIFICFRSFVTRGVVPRGLESPNCPGKYRRAERTAIPGNHDQVMPLLEKHTRTRDLSRARRTFQYWHESAFGRGFRNSVRVLAAQRLLPGALRSLPAYCKEPASVLSRPAWGRQALLLINFCCCQRPKLRATMSAAGGDLCVAKTATGHPCGIWQGR